MPGTYTGSRGELNFEADLVAALTSATVGWDKEVLKNPTQKDLEDNLRRILCANNTAQLNGVPLTDNEFKQVLEHIQLHSSSPVAANVLLNGKRIPIRSEAKRGTKSPGDEIYLDIFDPTEIAGGKSTYQIAEQPAFHTSGQYPDRRGDLLFLINGLPVIHAELKASGVPLEEGTNQIQKYMKEGVYAGLYSLVHVFFVITPEDAVYFANPLPQELNPAFFFHWADRHNRAIHDWHALVYGKTPVLSIPEAHMLIGHYTTASIKKDSAGIIEDINNGTLMAARPYQVHAVQAILRSVKNHKWGDLSPLGGYVWGTTGCGKTFTSYKAGQLIIDKNYADKVVFVVDRVELSDQSFDEYNSFARDGEPIKKAKNTHSLFRMLLNNGDRLIITSIQKLSRVNEEKSKYVSAEDTEKMNEKHIVFIIDEAHRSQFGKMHAHIKGTFTHALFIGFTGTPIFSENDKGEGLTSEAVFGDCLAAYSIADGIRDRNVLGFSPIAVRTYADKDLRNAIAQDKSKAADEDEAKQDKKKWEIWRRYQKADMTEIEALLPASQYDSDVHRKAVVEDILEHWGNLSGGPIRFHALLATESIREAVEYYRLLKGSGLKVTALFDPNLNGNERAVLGKEDALIEIVDGYNHMFGTGSVINRDADPKLKTFKADVTGRLAHKGTYKNIANEDMLDIVIVVDQLLTGFDSKYIGTLFLDKVADTDNLIQAISRTNRVLDFDEKPFGVFRYYRKPYTMDKNIREALRLYCEGGEDSGAIVGDAEENIKSANEVFASISQLFQDAGVRDFQHLPASDAAREKFRELFRGLSRLIKGLKLQGMKWEDDADKYAVQLDCCRKWIDGRTRLFDILQMRFRDMLPPGRDPLPRAGRAAYNLDASLSEVEKEKIDADYLESNFRIAAVKVVSDVSEEEKDRAVGIFTAQLAALPERKQAFAKQIICDIRTGELEPDGMPLMALIAKYEEAERKKKTAGFAASYFVDQDKLMELCRSIHTADNVGDIDMLVSRFLNDPDNCDLPRLQANLGMPRLRARAKLNAELREFLETAW